MQNYQPGTRLYVSYNAVDAMEYTCTGTLEGLLRVEPAPSENLGITPKPRYVPEDELEKVWSLCPQEAIAKRVRANILDIEETIKNLADKIKYTDSFIEYKKREISDLFATKKDIISKFPEMFL